MLEEMAQNEYPGYMSTLNRPEGIHYQGKNKVVASNEKGITLAFIFKKYGKFFAVFHLGHFLKQKHLISEE